MNIPLNIDWQQILLHLFNFVILAGGLYFILYKPVKSFMDKRIEHFALMEKEADEKINEAQKLKAEREEKLKASDEEILNLKAENEKKARELSLNSIKKAQKKADAILEEAEKRAESIKQKAITDSQKEIKDIASKAAERIIADSQKASIDEFLNAAKRGEDDGKNS